MNALTTADYDGIIVAVATIAGQCDGARDEDGVGFNMTDAYFGRQLAALPYALWDDATALGAWDMMRKYRGQLAATGIDYDTLPIPPGGLELLAERKEKRNEAAKEARANARKQAGKVKNYVAVEGKVVVLSFKYDEEMVYQAKQISGRHYEAEFGTHTKVNTYPLSSLSAVIDFADEHELHVPDEVRALTAPQPAEPAASATGSDAAFAVLGITEQPAHFDVRVERGQVVISTPSFNRDLYNALMAFNDGNRTWDRSINAHRLPPLDTDPKGLVDIITANKLTVHGDAQALIDAELQNVAEYEARLDRNRTLATAMKADPVDIPGLAEGKALMPHQFVPVRFAAENRRIIIGDEVGFGKTLSSLAAVAADGAYPAVVVCRPSLTLNWANKEIREFFPNVRVWTATGTTPVTPPADTQIVVIGSSALGTVDKPATKALQEAAEAAAEAEAKKAGKQAKKVTVEKVFPWVNTLNALNLRAVVIDEGQDAKESKAARTQACEQLARPVRGRDGLVLDLTGTPVVNRPKELIPQLTILGRIEEFGGEKEFRKTYCRKGSNLLELHDRLLSWGIMCRRTDTAMLGLPDFYEHELPIAAADLDAAVMVTYRKAEADIIAYLAAQARKIAEELGVDPDSAAVEAAMKARSAEHLVMLNALRKLVGQAKRPAVTRWVRRLVDAGEKVMIAAHHVPEVDGYAKEFGGTRLQGGQSVKDKEVHKKAFNEMPQHVVPVISVAIQAGGVGHTLTAACYGVQAEQAWTPGDVKQMSGRLYRITQKRDVHYFVALAEGTVDERVWEIVNAKRRILAAVLDGIAEDEADEEKSVAGAVAWQLAQQGLVAERLAA